MKLNFATAHVERSSNFASEFFDIGNKRVIMDILRSKMYSNAIKTICQEIPTNARDAHLEIGKENIPIEIKLPNKLEPYYAVRDYGPGISPSRISNVFILYGTSTKNTSNKEDGAFGLGAKSPFAYGDTFTVVSITPDESGQLIKREYLAHIDETGLGQITLVKEELTTELQGTCIIISVKCEDYENFATYTKQATCHWKTKPNIIGCQNWQWPTINIKFSGQNWEIHSETPLKRNGADAPFALINGIPYDLNLADIYDNKIPPTHQVLNTIPLRILFNIGEIPVTANREEIDYQSATKTYIAAKLDIILNEAKQLISAGLTQCQSLWAAIIFWRNLLSQPYGSLLEVSEWKGIKLFKELKVPNNGTIIHHYEENSLNAFGHKRCSSSNHIDIKNDTILVENDIRSKGIARNKIAKLFEQYSPKRVILVDFLKQEIKTVVDGITKTSIIFADETMVTNRKTAIHWDLLAAIKLSTVENLVRLPLNEIIRPKYQTLKLKYFSRVDQKWLEYKDRIGIKLYVITGGTSVILDEKLNLRLSINDFSNFLTNLDNLINHKKLDAEKTKVELFGAVPSQVSKLDNTWIPLYQYTSQKLEEFKNKIPPVMDYQYSISRQYGDSLKSLFCNNKFLMQLDSNSTLYQYIMKNKEFDMRENLIELHNKIAKRLNIKLIDSGKLSVNIVNADTSLQILATTVDQTYPLLKYVYPHYNKTDLAIDEIIKYVNLINKVHDEKL